MLVMGAIQVLWDVSFELNKKEIVCFIGTNGAGKTTFLNNIVGILKPFCGQIIYQNQDVTPAQFSGENKNGYWLCTGRKTPFPRFNC